MTMIAALLLAAAAASPALSGDWTVDLTARPGDAPYLKPMTLELKPDGSVAGRFYDSEIQAGRWKTQGGRTCVAFRTTDGKGPYHTSACLVGEEAIGQTWAEHRNFLFNWVAKRP